MSVDIDSKFQKLFKDLSQNVQKFPPESIQRGVILISRGNMSNQSCHGTFFDHISERTRELQKSKLCIYELENKVPLIDPTRRMLQPGEGCGFVIQHYLLRTMKQAKFIFVFDIAHTILPIKQFKATLQLFYKLFKQFKRVSEIADACGIIILDSKQIDFQTIKLRILDKGVCEKQYIGPQNNDMIQLCKRIFANGNVHLIKQFTDNDKNKKYIFKNPFIEFTKRLRYYDLHEVKEGRIQFNTSLPIAEAYTEYESEGRQDNNIIKYIKQIYDIFCMNIEVFANKKSQPLNQLPRNALKKPLKELVATYGELALIQIISSTGWNINNSQNKGKQSESIRLLQSEKLMNFLQRYINVIDELGQGVGPYSMTEIDQIFRYLHINGYIQNKEIQKFFLSVRHFLRCFPKIVTQGEIISIKTSSRNKENFGSNLYILIYRFIDFLKEDLQSTLSIPYDNYIRFFQRFFSETTKKINESLSNRMLKKLEKCYAEVAYLKAKRSQNEADKARNWLYFIQLSIKMPLIEQEKKEEAFLMIGMELQKKQEWNLALKIYEQTSIFKTNQKIIAIYQKRYKFAPEVIKYTKQSELMDNLPHLLKYCQFLMKIGFNEKVRQICFQGLRLSNDPSLKEELQSLLINARGDNYKSLHHKFLEEVLIDKIPIIYDEDLINEVERKFVV